MKWLSLIPIIAERIPFDKIFIRPMSKRKEIEELQEILNHHSANTPANASAPCPQPHIQAAIGNAQSPIPVPPTTAETIAHLKGRLVRFLSDFEDDLLDGGRIAGKPCDCLEKHSSKVHGVALELSSMDTDPVYSRIIDWLAAHQGPFTLANVAGNPPSYYRSLAPEVRDFRKHIHGTEPTRKEGREERFRRFAEQRGVVERR